MKRVIAFFEIPATDFERAVKFYENLLEITMETFSCESEQMAFFPKENNVCPGAIFKANGYEPSSKGVVITLHVENIEQTCERIIAGKGEILQEKTKIMSEERGYFALFKDTEGNTLGIYADK